MRLAGHGRCDYWGPTAGAIAGYVAGLPSGTVPGDDDHGGAP
jgi:hypothetical protein